MTPTGRPKRIWKGRTILIWTVLGAVVIFTVLSLLSDVEALKREILGFPPGLLVPIAVLSLGNYLLRFVKWHWYLKLMGHRVPRWSNLLVFFSGFALTVTPGKVGEFIKAFIVKTRFGVPYTASTAVLLMERFTDVVAILFLCFTGLFLEFLPVYVALLSVLLLAAFVVLIRNRKLAMGIIGRFRAYKRLRRFAGHLETFYSEGMTLLEPRVLAASMALSVVAWFLEGLGFALVAWGFGFGLSVMEGVFIYSAAIMAGALTLFAGGLGGTEGGLVGLGIAFGMTPAVSAGSTIVIRIMTLWFAVVMGWMVFFLTPHLRSLLSAAAFVADEE